MTKANLSNFCARVAAPVLFLGLVLGVGQPAAAVDTSIFADNQEDTYERCLLAAQSDPPAGLDMASRWQRLNGGEPAAHCFGVALLHIGDFEEASKRLRQLAESSSASQAVKAGLWSQTGRALVEAGNCTGAIEAFDTALSLRGLQLDVLIDRAICYGLLKDWWAAIDDLNAVIDRQPSSSEALTLRGSAYRSLGIHDLAEDDIDRVLMRDPGNVDALLERGLIHEAHGAMQSARMAWLDILQREPESNAADVVRRKLEQLDLTAEPIESEN